VRSGRHRQPFCYYCDSALSNRRLIASERDGLGSGWRSIHAASLASRSAGIRKPVNGVVPVRGRPGGLFGFSAIDLPLDFVQQKLCLVGAPPRLRLQPTKRFLGRRPMAAAQHKLSRRALLAGACAGAALPLSRHSGLDPESTPLAAVKKDGWIPDYGDSALIVRPVSPPRPRCPRKRAWSRFPDGQTCPSSHPMRRRNRRRLARRLGQQRLLRLAAPPPRHQSPSSSLRIN
jgi:hypothetical protein